MSKALERGAGILLPISSLPSPYGIGTMGRDAYDFVDMLKRAGQKYWQVLPIRPGQASVTVLISRFQHLRAIRILSIWIH